MKKILLLFILHSISSAYAEYRVYQYTVREKSISIANNGKAPTYTVHSTLNPISYYAYHGGQEAISVDLMRTWICPGHTGHFKNYCLSPYEKLTANQDEQKL